MIVDETDPWAWAHEERAPEPDPAGAASVVAVLVAHNGDAWLGRTLVEIARLNQRPGRIVGVDAGSDDGTRNLLDLAQQEGILDEVVSSGAQDGYGAAVDAALATSPLPENGWIWLLHDDLEPRRNSLTELLRAASEPPEGEPPADILVPKLLQPRLRNRPDQLAEIGESISVSGARVISVEPGDIDQRQDEPAIVLGGSTAGMFISAAAWRELSGLKASIPLFRDGVDLGWRANEAGLVVRTAPEAGLHHHRAGRLGIRESAIAPNPDVEDRWAGMQVVVEHSPHPRRTRTLLGLAGIGKSFGMLLGKSPSGARDMLSAVARLWRTPVPETPAATATLPPALLPGASWGLRHGADRVAGGLTDRYRDLVSDEASTSIDELTGDDFAGSRVSTRLLTPVMLGALVALFGTLIAIRHVFGLGTLTSVGLLPAPDGLGAAFRAWLAPDAGLAGSNAPWLGLAALGSVLTFGQPNLLAALLVLGGPALAAWSAHDLLRRRLPRAPWQAMALAGAWGLLLPVIGATSDGRLDLAVAAIVLPRLAGAFERWRTHSTAGGEGLRAPGAVALWLAVLAVCYPLVWLVSLPLIAALAVIRSDVRGGLVAAFGPLVVLAPWLPRLAGQPGRLLTGIDPTAAPADAAVNPFLALLGRTAGTTTPLVVSIVVLGLLALFGLVALFSTAGTQSPRQRLALAATVAGGASLAMILTRFVVTIDGVPVRPDGRPWVLVAAWGLIGLGAMLFGQVAKQVDVDAVAADSTFKKGLRVGGTVALILVVLASGGWWLLRGAGAPLGLSSEVLPSYILNVQDSSRASRTLMVDLVDGEATYALVDSTNPSWGSGERSPLIDDPDAALMVSELAQQFAEGQPSDDLAERLGRLAIGHVWLRGASQDATSSLANAGGLDVSAGDEDVSVFTVANLPSRVMLRTAGAEEPVPNLEVPAGPSGRLLVISEPADTGWRAELNGVRLTPTASGDWRAAFELPADAGAVRWSMRPGWLGMIWELLGWAGLLVLAAPSAGSRASGPRRALATTSRRRRA